MPTEKKIQAVSDLKEMLAKANIGILTDYRGLKTADLNVLRKKLRDVKVEYKVVKNKLAVKAAESAGMEYASEGFKGPMAVAFGYGELNEAAKALTEFIKSTKSTMTVKGGFMENKLLTAKDIDTLAKLPGKKQLISMVLAGMQSPMYGIVNVLAAPMRGLAQVLNGRMKQLEGK
jgi:large subunit ribosomal protein L10